MIYLQLKTYHTKFKNRLSPKHALHLKRLVLFISALSGVCQTFASATSRGGEGEKAPAQGDMLLVGDLVAKLGAKVDGFNLLEVVAYLRESKLARKVTSAP